MKKDIEWLKKKIGGLPCVGTTFNRYGHGPSYIASAVSVMAVYDLIDKLDEPEVLSPEWVDDNSIYASHDGITEEYVHVDDLKELLMPKQELPVIPKFVAEYLDYVKERSSLIQVLEMASRPDELPKFKKENVWISANDEAFARAWLDGFMVEEEPLYRARLKVIIDKFIASYLRT